MQTDMAYVDQRHSPRAEPSYFTAPFVEQRFERRSNDHSNQRPVCRIIVRVVCVCVCVCVRVWLFVVGCWL